MIHVLPLSIHLRHVSNNSMMNLEHLILQILHYYHCRGKEREREREREKERKKERKSERERGTDKSLALSFNIPNS